jgi:uncharacterized protein YrzB (UPF0473 family)
MESTVVKILDDNGNLVEHNILFTFECEELGKNYIAYDGNSIGSVGKPTICVVSYDPNVDLNKLEPVTDSEELKMVNDVINQIVED